MAPDILGTADIPQKYWKDARLIGQVPFIASIYDQRISYCMYVPSAHYSLEPAPEAKLPLVVHVHGSLRKPETCRDSLIELADRTGSAILAPLFPIGLDDPNEIHAYKRMSFKGTRYDNILLAIIDEVALRWPGIDTQKFFLLGFSGGGQFSMRFFYLHPNKLEAVSIGAPGLVTSLDDNHPWPLGIKNVGEHFEGLSVDLHALKQVEAIQLAIGADDEQEVGGGLVQWMRNKSQNSSSDKLDAEDTRALDKALRSRKEAIFKLNERMQSLGLNTEVTVVDNATHESAKVLPYMIDFIERRVETWKTKRKM